MTGTHADGLRLAAAREVGADDDVDVDAEDLVRAGRGRSRAGGWPTSSSTSPTRAAVTVRLALDLAAMNGRVLLAGLKNMAPVELPSDLIVLKGLTADGRARLHAGVDAGRGRAAPRDARSRPQALRGEVLTLDELDEAMALVARTGDHDAVRVSLRHT